MIIYIVLYIVLYIIYFLSLYINKKATYKLLHLSFLILLVFSSFRYMVGWDYSAYYDAVKYSIDNNITTGGELLTIALVNLTRQLGKPYVYFLINAAILIYSVQYLIKKYSLEPWLSFFIFLGFPLFYLNSLSVVRTFTALGLILIAVSLLQKRRLPTYFAIVIIASLFHKSALFALFFPLFLYFKPSKTLWIILLSAAPFLGNLGTSILMQYIPIYLPKYTDYVNDTDSQQGTKAIVILIVSAIIFILFHKKSNYTDDSYENFYHIFIFGVFFYLVLLSTGTAAHRTSLYATIFLIILLPNFINRIKPLSLRYILYFIVHIIFIVSFFYTIKVGAETYIPYSLIFSNN